MELRVPIPPGQGCLSVVSVVCFQVEVSATGRSVVQLRPADCGVPDCGVPDCGVPDCDRESSKMRRSWPTGGSRAMGGGVKKERRKKVVCFPSTRVARVA